MPANYLFNGLVKVEERDFSAEDIGAIYRVIKKRRDVRSFINKEISDEILQRILEAGMHAPSVGYMQPCNFLVIRDISVRKKIHSAFQQANAEAKEMFSGERGELYSSLKLEGILDSSLNICVTCDRSRFGDVVLGRTCQADMDLYSAVCAVQNMWLAARAEGIGIGWVSIIKPEDLQDILLLPKGVVVIAYLCVGYTKQFATEPELKTKGWLPQIDFSDLVFYDKWGNTAKKTIRESRT